MSPTRIGAALALLALALLLTLPAGASADSSSPTWAGTWDTDFGEMTLNAGGAGSYTGFSPGTVSGPADGRVNEGTWYQPGDPPRSGPYKFTMSGNGLFFTGVWAYAQGGCGSACGWNGECKAGACLKNDDPPPTQPPPCGGSSIARAAAKTCDLGKLPFGSEFSVPGPSRGETVNISPKPVLANAVEVWAAIRDLLILQEQAEIIVAITLAGGGDIEIGTKNVEEALDGCVLMGEGILGSKASVHAESRFALVRACGRLLLDEAIRGGHARTAAADGCNAVFVPAFAKDRKVTKRMRRRAVAQAKSLIAMSCKQRRPGRLSVSVRARGRGATLREVTGRRLGAKVARRVSKGAPEQRLGVRWRAPKR
jgi:hypothetical protein